MVEMVDMGALKLRCAVSLASEEAVDRLAAQLLGVYAKQQTVPDWHGAEGEQHLRDLCPEEIAMLMDVTPETARKMVVDLTACPFADLPDYWKRTFREEARTLLTIVSQTGAANLLEADFEHRLTRLRYGTLVQAAWADRYHRQNDDRVPNPLADKAFVELTPEDRQWQVERLIVAQNWLREQKVS